MNESTKEDLVRQFRDYLDRPPEEPQKGQRLDLISFYNELIALKNEVKIESRQVKNGLDEFSHVITLIEESNRTITARLERDEKNGLEALEKSLLQPLFTGLLDIHDRIVAAQQAGKNSRPSFLSWFCGRETALIKAMRQGQKITLSRLDELLAHCRINPIATSGRSFDPHTMRAVATDTDPQLADGVVSAELRRGFMWKDEVLRPAEVKVNVIVQQRPICTRSG